MSGPRGLPERRGEARRGAPAEGDGPAAARRRPAEVAASAALGLLALVTVVRSQAFDGVVYGGDEYAYLARALFPRALLERTDPWLQDLSNHGYLALVRAADAGPWRLQLVHLLSALLLVAGGALTVLLARRFLDRLPALLAGLLYFLLPTTGYVSTAMPEPVYAAAFALVAFLVVQRDGALTGPRALAGGLAVGALFSVKPHAVAVLVATCAYAAVAGLAGAARDGAPRPVRAGLVRAAARVALVLAGFWGASVLAAGLLGGAWSASPGALVGGVYVESVGSAASGSFWGDALPAIARYAGAHLATLLMLFGVPAAVFLADARRAVSGHPEGAARRAQLAPALFALLVLGAAAAMASIFTAQVGALAAGEADRLHARYYSFALPLAMVGGLAVLRGRPPQAAVRAGAVAMLAGLAAFALLSRGLRLFPWDAADVFALYDRTTTYWHWDGAPGGFRAAAFACLAAAGLVALLGPRLAPPALVAAWAVVLALGNLSVHSWQRSHMRGAAPYYQDARAFSALLRGREPGSGVLVGRERFGAMPYALAGLANAPHVRVVPGTTLTDDVLPPEASWVVAVDAYVPELAHESAVAGERLTLYLRRRGGAPAIVDAGGGAALERPLELGFAAGQPGADLVGFHPREPWGSWTALPAATVVLERPLHGRYRITLRAWVTEQHAGTPLRLRVGGREYAVDLGTAPGERALEVVAPEPVDRLELHMPTSSGAPWERRLGVAVASMTLAPLP